MYQLLYPRLYPGDFFFVPYDVTKFISLLIFMLSLLKLLTYENALNGGHCPQNNMVLQSLLLNVNHCEFKSTIDLTCPSYMALVERQLVLTND